MDHFAAIAAERRTIADLLGSLTDEQWNTQSCCNEWTVGEVAAHLTTLWNFSSLDFMKRAGANRSTWFKPQAALAALNSETVTHLLDAGRSAVIADLRNNADDRTTPIGFDSRAPMTDTVVHRRDIEAALGMEASGPPEHAVVALESATSPRFVLFNNKKLLRGLSFHATDTEWQSGAGPGVSGPARVLAHAMWGRTDAIEDLTGSGVETLRASLAAR